MFGFMGTLPVVGTEIAGRWDALYIFLVWLSVFFFVLVVGAMIYFAIKYRSSVVKKTRYITGNHLLEGIWIAVPTILLLVIFGWGYVVYRDMTQSPIDAYEIRVIGKQWLWTFQYDNGTTTVGELYVPINKPVKLIMTSQDVLHDFFIPNFRVKQDVVPGMYTSVWFEARVPGKHQVFCAEYCGTSHSGMLAQVIALDDTQWKAWLAGGKITDVPKATDEIGAADAPRGTLTSQADTLRVAQAAPELKRVSMVMQGKNVFESKGCVSCHSVDGTHKIGPSAKGLYGSKPELMDGTHVTADENYLRESIESPQAKLVKGYSPVMPTFKGLIDETEMNALLAYFKSIAPVASASAQVK